MKKLSLQEAEMLASKFRVQAGLNLSEPLCPRIVLRMLNITAMFRPLSETSYGISCKSKSGRMFMMVNSNSTIGRQNFTIAHELYHLFYDESPTPHMCRGMAEGEEKNANIFASSLLLPQDGILPIISFDEIVDRNVHISTILFLEQLYSVSRQTIVFRLKDLGLLTRKRCTELLSLPVRESAKEYGYDTSLYEPGNEGLFIGNFGTKARTLYENGKISEGHYNELLNMLSYAEE